MATDATFRFNGLEVVRLKYDADYGLKAGDCGVVWGVYKGDPPSYEATFINQTGTRADLMFKQEEVDELVDVSEAPFPDRLEDIRRILN